MNVKVARESNISDIMNLISDCIMDMESQGIYQWNDGYPTLDVITKDVQSKSLYIMKRQGDILGIITLDEEQEPQYKEIKWFSDGESVLVVHRLAVHPKWQHRRIGRKLMDFAEQFAIENSYTSIRLDVYSQNPRAVSFYETRDYNKAGQVYFAMRELPFYCYEKVFSY